MKSKTITFLMALPVVSIVLFHLYQLVLYGQIMISIKDGLNYLSNYNGGGNGDIGLRFFILMTYPFIFTYILVPMFFVGLILQLRKTSPVN